MKDLSPWAVLWVAFITAYFSELGCMIRTGSLVLSSRSPLLICLGTLLGNVAVLLPFVLFGDALIQRIPSQLQNLVPYLGGGALIVTGLWMIFNPHHS